MKLQIVILVLLSISSQVLAGRQEPQAQIDTFFRVLNDKSGSAAIDNLCKGTLLESQKKAELVAAATQLDAVYKIYGKIARNENVDKKNFGESFIRLRLISYHDSGAPLFWEFMFVKLRESGRSTSSGSTISLIKYSLRANQAAAAAANGSDGVVFSCPA